MTLYLHEVHRVVGASEDDFHAAYRDPGGWMDQLARGDDARLLWYLEQAHGTGPSYRTITLTAINDGAAWERLAQRLHNGDLTDWAHHTDTLRHDLTAKLLLPAPWSPLHTLDLTTVPTTPADHPPTLYMEDTMWPLRGQFRDYLDAAHHHYAPMLDRPEALLQLKAAWVTATGAGTHPEVVLWQAVREPAALLRLFTTDIPPERRAPGTWMHDALQYRDQWRSRLLRTASWSPWP